MGKKTKSTFDKSEPSEKREPLISIQLFVNGVVDSRNSTLLGGFLHQEKVAKRLRDTKTNYASRFEEFKGK